MGGEVSQPIPIRDINPTSPAIACMRYADDAIS